MLKRIASILLTAVLALNIMVLMPVYAEGTENIKIYVSPDGSDSAKGTIESPFKTLERAKAQVRKLNKNMKSDIEVIFRGGTYRFDDTIVFESYDSATNGHKIIYKAYEGETPVFTGAKLFEGKFVKDEGRRYVMDIPKGVETRMLMVNGKGRTIARYPNGSYSSYTEEKVTDKWYTFRLDDNLNNILDGTEENVWIHTISSYGTVGMTLDEIYKTADGRVMGRVNDKSVYIRMRKNPGLAGYYIENNLKLLDNEGEYYIDSEKGKLYYIPTETEAENLDECVIEYADLATLIKFDGTKKNQVKGITFDGISFTGTADNDLMVDGYSDVCSAYTDDYLQETTKEFNPVRTGMAPQTLTESFVGAIHGVFVTDLNIENCLFYHMEESAIVLNEGSRRIVIKGNTFDHIGANAIFMSRQNYRTLDTAVYLEDITISENYMYYIAMKHNSCGAVLVNGAANLTMEHNDLEYMAYGGLMTNAQWYMDYQIWKTGGYVIRNNKVKHIAKSVYANDGGPIYNGSPRLGDNIISGNYVIGDELANVSGYGVYFDGNSRHWLMENNVIVGYGSKPIYIQIVSTQIATHITADNNYISPFPTYTYGNITNGDAFRVNKNTINNAKYYASPEHFPKEAVEIMNNAGLSDEYKHLYEKIEKPYMANAGASKYTYRYKEGVESSIPVKITNNTDKETKVDFEIIFPKSPHRNFEYSATVPANSKERVVDIPVLFDNVESLEYGSFIVLAQFEDGTVMRAGAQRSYDYVAEDVDYFMIDTASDGYSEEGVWINLDYYYDKFGRIGRFAKDTTPASSTFSPEFLPDGKYKVIVGGFTSTMNDSAAKYIINCGDKQEEVILDMTGATAAAEWELGEFEFKQGENNYIKYERTNWQTEAKNSGMSCYVIFERIGTTAIEESEIRREYIKWRDEPEEITATNDDVVTLKATRDADQYSYTATVNTVTLKNGRECVELTNALASLHFDTDLKDGVYEVYIRANIANNHATKMNAVIMGANDTINIKYDLTKGKDGWISCGKLRFSSNKKAEIFVYKELGDAGKGIVDEIKLVRVAD